MMQWQFFWEKWWQFGYLVQRTYEPGQWDFDTKFLIIGPLQLRWRGQIREV